MQIKQPTQSIFQDENSNNQSNQSIQNNIALGIDLGTTNSLVCISDAGAYDIVVDITKSIIIFCKNGNILAGDNAFEKLKNHPAISQKYSNISGMQFIECLNGKNEIDFVAIKSVKSIIGKDVKIPQIFGKTYTATQISSILLSRLKKLAEEKLSRSVDKVVITVPAYFDDTQRAETKKAAQHANLEVLRLINEPTAAALAYGIDHQKEGIYAVFDLGGGTFDVSILKMQMGVFKVIATGGDTRLGGDDFDRIIANKFNISQADGCYIKEYLSDHDSINRMFLNLQTQKPFSIHLTRDQFDENILSLVHKAVDIFRSVLKDAKIESNQLDGVVLVGGSTRMPIIKEAIENEFTSKIFNDLDEDRVVAFGAAIQAENLTRKNINTLLLDVTPLSLGIELMGGSVQKIIYRNTQIPFSAHQNFTTYEDNQTAIEITILQGERDMAKDCRSLGKFSLSGIPPLPAGVPDVKISFFIDADGILTVSAREELTQIEQSIQIRPTYGINTNDVLEMIDISMQNARNDIQAKLDSDQKIDATSVIKKIQSQMAKYSQILTKNEQDAINAAIQELDVVINHSENQKFDRSLANNLVANLNNAAMNFVKHILEHNIKNEVSGIKIDKIKVDKDK